MNNIIIDNLFGFEQFGYLIQNWIDKDVDLIENLVFAYVILNLLMSSEFHNMIFVHYYPLLTFIRNFIITLVNSITYSISLLFTVSLCFT